MDEDRFFDAALSSMRLGVLGDVTPSAHNIDNQVDQSKISNFSTISHLKINKMILNNV